MGDLEKLLENAGLREDSDNEFWDELVGEIQNAIDGVRALEIFADDYAEILKTDYNERKEIISALSRVANVYNRVKKSI